jgi:hypothetical protein
VSAPRAPRVLPSPGPPDAVARGAVNANGRLRSLALATRVRARRGELRRQIGSLSPREGRRALATWLSEPPDWLLSAQTVETLSWPRYLGARRARQLIRRARVPEQRRVGELTDADRSALVALLVGETESVTTTPGGTVTRCEEIIRCDPGRRAGDAP